jgi:hypothetical protein
MNVREGLEEIKRRLEGQGARPATLQAVDLILRRAALPAASAAPDTSLLKLVRMLMRTPAANTDTGVYNDLARLEEELEGFAAAHRERAAAEEARPVPKSRKHYKELRDRERRESARPSGGST